MSGAEQACTAAACSASCSAAWGMVGALLLLAALALLFIGTVLWICGRPSAAQPAGTGVQHGDRPQDYQS